MEYIGEDERVITQYGLFKPGDVVDYDKSLHSTGFFRVEDKKKDGDK